MTQLVKLYDERSLLVDLQGRTLSMVHGCTAMDPVKKFVECYDILDLTLSIRDRFPTEFPTLPVCDEDSLLHLKHLTRELLVYHGPYLPHPDFEIYTNRVEILLRIFAIPRGLKE